MTENVRQTAPELTWGTLWVTCDNSPACDGTGPQNGPEGTVDMKSIDNLREWANGLHGVYINRVDHTITVTTGWDSPPDMDSVSLRDHINGILDGIEREYDKLVMKLNAEHIVRQNVERENVRQREWIREAVRFMGCVTECDAGGWAVWMDELVKKARELGVEP